MVVLKVFQLNGQFSLSDGVNIKFKFVGYIHHPVEKFNCTGLRLSDLGKKFFFIQTYDLVIESLSNQ